MKDKDNKHPTETCYNVYARHGAKCNRSQCRYWLSDPTHMNCAILASREGPKTLEEVGQMFNLTRMRICQIESSIKKKLRVIS